MNFNDDTFLARWLNDELTSDELKTFKASNEYKEYKKIADKSTQFQIPDFDKAGIRKKIQSGIKQPIEQSNTSKVIPLFARWASAAAIVLICALTGVFYWTNAPTVFTSAVGEQLAFTLPDGSSVTLNGNASVTFSEKDWNKNKRDLELDGEGYFKVKKGSKFNVHTDQGTVSVVGTQFNVQALDTYLAVECYEGKVSVKNTASQTLLTPGNAIRFKNGKAENFTFSYNAPNWTTNKYNYNTVPLYIVLNDLKNVYKLTIEHKSVNLTQEFTGKLITYDINKALKAVCMPMKLKYSIKNNKRVVISSN